MKDKEIEKIIKAYKRFTKGVRINTLKRLIWIFEIYCTGYSKTFIDLYERYAHKKDENVIKTKKELVEFLIKQEKLSRRTAYDYATFIEKIQIITR